MSSRTRAQVEAPVTSAPYASEWYYRLSLRSTVQGSYRASVGKIGDLNKRSTGVLTTSASSVT